MGLGWNVNVGCITRNIEGYPDDAYDNQVSVNVSDPGGSGYVKNYFVYEKSWDSQKGYGGGVSLYGVIGAYWDKNGLTSGTLLGVNFNRDGVSQYWADAVFGVANSVLTIIGFADIVESMGKSAASSGTGAQAAARYSVLGQVGMTALNIGSLLLMGAQSEGTFASRYYNWNTSTTISNRGLKVDYKWWLDDTRTERAFGSLYFEVALNLSTLKAVNNSPDYNSYSGYTPGTEWPRYTYPSPYQVSLAKGFKADASQNTVCSDMFTYVGPTRTIW